MYTCMQIHAHKNIYYAPGGEGGGGLKYFAERGVKICFHVTDQIFTIPLPHIHTHTTRNPAKTRKCEERRI